MPLLGALSIGLGACAQDPPVGQVGVTLVSPSADGSLYRLPEDAYLTLEGDGFYDNLPLGGDVETITAALPAGDYTARLNHPGGYDTQWPLTHELADGTIEEVTAELTSPQPQAFTVTEGGTTALVLRFQVPELGTVSFGQGNVDITVVVDETGAGGLELSWTVDVAASEVTTFDDLPAALAPAMPTIDDTVAVAITAEVTGSWTQTGLMTACAPASFSLESATGHELLVAVVSEAFTDLGDLCLITEAGTSRIGATFVGAQAPTTPPFSDLDVGATTQLFVATFQADLGVEVFDGSVLDLAALPGAHTLPTTGYVRVDGFPDSGDPREQWFTARASGSGDLVIAPSSTVPAP